MMAASSGTSHEVWPHLLTLGFSTVAFSTFYVLSPTISAALFGTRYTQLSSRARRDWNARTVALVHALIILSLAVRALSSLDLPQDRIFGVDRSGAARLACAVAAGYFVWDVAVSAFVLRDLAFVVHGVLCCGIYVHSLRPFLAHYAVRFLLWELSTPLLNIHWFLDKLGKTGSKLQLVNGIALLTVFALVRLAYGPYLSANFVGDMIAVRSQIHPVVLVAYILGNAVLNGLNYFWFYKMIKSLRKRFGRSDQPKKREFELVDT